MDTTRQDAWTKDEDLLLAETVLRYIREGKTQLEAFKQVANLLSRTSAACGFRWNATIRKQYKNEIEQAKEKKIQGNKKRFLDDITPLEMEEVDRIDTAILLLKEMKQQTSNKRSGIDQQNDLTINKLKKENEWLKKQLNRYDEAWQEMGALWNWVKATNEENTRSL